MIVRICQSEPALDGETLTALAAATVGSWLRAWRAVHDNSWDVGQVDSPEQKYKVIRKLGPEPYVTVFNKTWDGFSLTVHSHDNGQQAVTAAAAFVTMKEILADKMPSLFEAAKKADTPPAPKSDINNVDAFLGDSSQSPAPSGQAEALGNVYVSPAKSGSIEGTIKLEKGAKDKLTWETAILPKTPYSANSDDFQEKDVLVYPITGAIRYEGSSSGFYFAIPVPSSEIRVYVRDATTYEGKVIESDSQKLAQHLGLKNVELTQGMKWNVPATHIAMKVGKKSDKGRFKNYVGLYELK